MQLQSTKKFVVMGAGGVRKTSLVVQFIEGSFSPVYKPTIEDYYRPIVQLPDGMFHAIEILDTAGTHNFPAMRELNIRSGIGFALVFSVKSLRSFQEIIKLYEEIYKIKGSNVPIVIAGNKCDLVESRTVSLELINQTRIEKLHNTQYIETSAKFNSNVASLFMEVLKEPALNRLKISSNFKKREKFIKGLSFFNFLA